MAVHVLGNGPSLSNLFHRNDWPDSDIFIGCNFSDESLRPNYTVFIDVKPIRLFGEKGYRLRIPTILSDKAHDYIVNELKHRYHESYINIREIFPLIHWTDLSKSTAMNSGHHAVMYAIQNESDTVIHIWGIDSFWQNDLASLTDSYTNNKSSRIDIERANVWRLYWLEIFKRYSNHTFIIHTPKDTELLIDLKCLPNTAVDRAF
jgi:hypothetical protein